MSSLQEAAAAALKEQQDTLAEREREHEESERTRRAKWLVRLCCQTLDLANDDPRLAQIPANGEITLDGLRFRLFESRDYEYRTLQVLLPCHLCGNPAWQNVGSLAALGDLLAHPENAHCPGFACLDKDEEEGTPVEAPPKRDAKFCPLTFLADSEHIELDCMGEKCAWWCQSNKCCSVKLMATDLRLTAYTCQGE